MSDLPGTDDGGSEILFYHEEGDPITLTIAIMATRSGPPAPR